MAGNGYGITPEAPEMTRKEQKDMAALGMLYGAEFEIEFMKSMIRHHLGAIADSSQCLRRAAHSELITWESSPRSPAEIRQLQTWLCDGYGICNYGPRRSETIDPQRHDWLDQ